MNKKEAEKEFKETILPLVKDEFEQDGKKDIPARAEAWNNWTDDLCKSNQITNWQYNNWVHPR